MEIQQYLKNLKHCNDKNPPPKRSEETINKIKQHKNLQSIETKLLPVMNSLLAFVESPISFTNYSFNQFLHINTYKQNEATTKQLEDFFLTEYETELNKAKQILYHNTNTYTKLITEHLANIGIIEQQKEKLEQIQESITRKRITCPQFSWIKKFPFVNGTLKFSKRDYEEYGKIAQQKTRNYLEIIQAENIIDEKIYAALSKDEDVFLKKYL